MRYLQAINKHYKFLSNLVNWYQIVLTTPCLPPSLAGWVTSTPTLQSECLPWLAHPSFWRGGCSCTMLPTNAPPQAHPGVGPCLLPLLCHSPSWVPAAASVPWESFSTWPCGVTEWCCITPPVSAPRSLPTVTNFHTSCFFWSWLLCFKSLLEVPQLQFHSADGSLVWSILEKWPLRQFGVFHLCTLLTCFCPNSWSYQGCTS